MTHDLTLPERLVADAAETFLAAMPDDLVSECEALVALDPSSAGIRMHFNAETDSLDLTWVGRWLGSIPGDVFRAAACASARRDDTDGPQ